MSKPQTADMAVSALPDEVVVRVKATATNPVRVFHRDNGHGLPDCNVALHDCDDGKWRQIARTTVEPTYRPCKRCFVEAHPGGRQPGTAGTCPLCGEEYEPALAVHLVRDCSHGGAGASTWPPEEASE